MKQYQMDVTVAISISPSGAVMDRGQECLDEASTKEMECPLVHTSQGTEYVETLLTFK